MSFHRSFFIFVFCFVVESVCIWRNACLLFWPHFFDYLWLQRCAFHCKVHFEWFSVWCVVMWCVVCDMMASSAFRTSVYLVAVCCNVTRYLAFEAMHYLVVVLMVHILNFAGTKLPHSKLFFLLGFHLWLGLLQVLFLDLLRGFWF